MVRERLRSPLLSWTVVVPVVALLLLGLTWNRDLVPVLVVVVAVVLAAVVLAAVHAEVVALRAGEPYGSGMASIGLTIPVIAIATVWLDGPLLLGLGATQMVLLGLTVVVSVLTVVPGRATRLQGGVHLVLLAAFLFLAINP